VDDLAWLENWFTEAAGGWQHRHAIEITSLLVDEPAGGAALGWQVTINLQGTEAAELSLDPVEVRRSEHDYVVCAVYPWPEEEGGLRFEGYCGPGNLRETLRIFREWVEADRPD
jgi:Immunity protein 53